MMMVMAWLGERESPTVNVQQQDLKGKLNSGSAYQSTYISKPEPRLAGENCNRKAGRQRGRGSLENSFVWRPLSERVQREDGYLI